MPTDRVLIEIVTAANMAGIEQAKAGMLGLNVATAALAAGLAILYKIGSDGVENYKKQEEATNLLTQAYATQSDTLNAHKKEIENFLSTNARFIADQYDTQQAMASLIRAGYDTATALRILGDALDLAAIKHEPVTDAEKQLLLALTGNKRTLKELGITSQEYDHIMKSKTLTTAQKHIYLLKLIEHHTRGGRNAIEETTQKQSELTKAWQDFTSRIGPPVLQLFSKLQDAAATGLGILNVYLDAVQKNIELTHRLLIALGLMDAELPAGAGMAQAALNAAAKIKGGGGKLHLKPKQHKATGGPVAAGEEYLVGEQGPETLVMGSQGGTIIPHGAGRGGVRDIHIHIDRGAYIDGPGIDILTNRIAQRLSALNGI